MKEVFYVLTGLVLFVVFYYLICYLGQIFTCIVNSDWDVVKMFMINQSELYTFHFINFINGFVFASVLNIILIGAYYYGKVLIEYLEK